MAHDNSKAAKLRQMRSNFSESELSMAGPLFLTMDARMLLRLQ